MTDAGTSLWRNKSIRWALQHCKIAAWQIGKRVHVRVGQFACFMRAHRTILADGMASRSVTVWMYVRSVSYSLPNLVPA